jgi:hypothetical protein
VLQAAIVEVVREALERREEGAPGLKRLGIVCQCFLSPCFTGLTMADVESWAIGLADKVPKSSPLAAVLTAGSSSADVVVPRTDLLRTLCGDPQTSWP